MKHISYFVFIFIISASIVHHNNSFSDNHSEPAQEQQQEMTFLQKVTGFFKRLFSRSTPSEAEQKTDEESTDEPQDTEQPEESNEQQTPTEQEQPTEQQEEAMGTEMNAGQKFLDENKNKPGVTVTSSGLQYKILKEGNQKPVATDTVHVHYRGTLIDGKPFESSYESNQPVSFPLSGVIPGWTEGLQLVGVGGKIQLFIPPNLAYGSRETEKIPANSVLIFDIDLLEIK